MARKTTEQFAQQIKEKHNLTLNCQYLGAHEPVTFLCPNGHENTAMATNLLQRGYKCKECIHGRSILPKLTWTDKEINKVQELLDEAKTVEEIAIEFKTTVSAIHNQIERNDLKNSHKLRTTKKLKEVLVTQNRSTEGSYYTHEYAEITCKNNHQVSQLVSNVINGANCPQCEKPKTSYYKVKELLKQQDRTLITTIEDYNYTKSQVTIKCQNNHIVEQRADTIIQGTQCPKCITPSKPEKELREFIEQNYSGWIVNNDRTILEGKELDIVLPDINLAFELNGVYWHQDKPDYHLAKTEKAEREGYQLIHITDYDWINKSNIVKSRILQLLNRSTRIYARNTKIKCVDWQETKNFLEQNHLQGKGNPTKYNYALLHEDTIVAIMTFGRPRFNTNQEWELIRYANKLNTTVIGGASKLFKYHNPKSCISYAARDYSKGNLYEKLGFRLDHITQPGYAYYKNNIKLSRYQCQKHKLEELLSIYDPKLSESELMKLNGYAKVYDSGNRVYVFEPISLESSLS